MTVIGTFAPTADGYIGYIRTLIVRRRVNILANELRESEQAPDFKLLCGETKIGVAWKAQSRSGQHYLSVQIDDPAWPNPIKASLFEHDGRATLCWNRKRGDT